MVCGFWVGYYTGGIPVDIILGFTVLGVVGGFELRGVVHRPKQWMWASAAGYAAASLILIAIWRRTPNGFLRLSAEGFWEIYRFGIAIGATGGAAAGLITASFLAKFYSPLPKRRRQQN
jgi:O-antigen/teichoic acid export membrane protein